jgi:hypothetical protein
VSKNRLRGGGFKSEGGGTREFQSIIVEVGFKSEGGGGLGGGAGVSVV